MDLLYTKLAIAKIDIYRVSRPNPFKNDMHMDFPSQANEQVAIKIGGMAGREMGSYNKCDFGEYCLNGGYPEVAL